jgi:basic amino acid/polyamine antiporter, APA family
MSIAAAPPKPLGFWSSWALTVGCMIGSGVFTLPAVLAPYGLLSFGGWLISGAGSIALALVFARLASRTTRSGGPYVYAQSAFGDLTGFLIAWGYWCSYVISIAAVAIAFAGYLPVFFPALADNQVGEALAALALIWALTLINIRGLRDAGIVQIATTLLKIVPLLAIAALGFFTGAPSNLPEFNPQAAPVLPALAATALLTLWAFTGFEAGVMPAAAVTDAERTIPRAIVIGMVTVTAIYLAATFAVMLLVPAETLAQSSAPFAEAARGFGAWGPALIGAGALIATAGTANGMIFVAGQMPMAVALDKLAPSFFARTNAGGAPYVSLLISSALGSLLLLANYTRGAIGAFTFLAMMATVTVLLPYFVGAMAELRHSWASARAWACIAILGAAYSLFAIVGSGLEVIAWGGVLLTIGLPLYFVVRRAAKRALKFS